MATGLVKKDLVNYSGTDQSRTKKIFEMIRDGKSFEVLDTSKEVLAKKVKLEFKNDDIKFLFEKDSQDNLAAIGVLTGGGRTFFKSGDKEFKLGQLYKSPADFGGGKGSGGGAADTAINESLQCFYSSILFNTSETTLNADNCSLANLKAQSNYCHTQASASGTKYTKSNFNKELYNKAPEDWITIDKKLGTNVYMRIAQKLYNSPHTAPLRKYTGIHFHRGSDFMSAIYAARKRAWDAEKGMTTGRIAPASGFSNDKWNPGDIWISNLDPNPKNSNPLCFADKNKSRCQTWDDLKDHVLQDAKGVRGPDHIAGAILGVSLKKVGETPSVKEFNGGQVSANGKVTHKRIQNVDVTYGGYVFGQTGNFFSSADCYMHFGDGAIMQLRSTATTTSWQGEVKGGKASGGKIGGGGINYFCESILKKSIGHGTALQGVKGSEGGGWKEITTVNKTKMWELYKKYNKLQKGGVHEDFYSTIAGKNKPIVKIKINKTPNPYTGLSADFEMLEEGDTARGYNKNFISYVIKSDSQAAKNKYVNRKDFDILSDNYINNKGAKSAPAFYFSKNMCLLFFDAIYVGDSPNAKIKQFATNVKRYAMSNIDIATYFLKIY